MTCWLRPGNGQNKTGILQKSLKILIKKASAQGFSKTSGVFASFHETKCAAVARLFEGKARVSKPQAHKSME